MILAVSDTNMD